MFVSLGVVGYFVDFRFWFVFGYFWRFVGFWIDIVWFVGWFVDYDCCGDWCN